MTTRVMVHAADGKVLVATSQGMQVSSVILDKGEEKELYVYPGMTAFIREATEQDLKERDFKA